MKITQVSPKYYPSIGGVENHVKAISERLVDRGHDVRVITGDRSKGQSKYSEQNGVNITRCYGIAPSDSFHIAPGIITEVNKSDSDLVHAHNYHALPMLFSIIPIRNQSVVTTPHYHGGSADPFRNRLLKIYRPIGDWALHSSAQIIAVSQWEREKIKEDFEIDPKVIPNGIDTDRFKKSIPESRRNPYLLTVGRLEKYKGIQYIIRALQKLPKYELVVAGTGNFLSELQKTAHEVGVLDRVSFEGYVDDDRLVSLYSGADVYLALSEFEAYGLTVGEALAAGTPCIVREAGGLIDWTRRPDCFGVCTVDPTTISIAVEQVRDVEAPHPNYPLTTWNDVTDQLVKVYESIMNRN